MGGMERIRDSILSEARAQAEDIIKEAEDKVKEIKLQLEKQAEQLTENRLQRAKIEAKEAASRMISMQELELKKKSLGVKQDLIDQAFEKALTRLKDLPEEKYADMVVSILGSAGLTGDEEIVVSPGDRAIFEKGLLKKINDKLGYNIKLSDETRNMQGGFIVKTRGVEINNSFETLLRMEREKVETEIAKILFQQ